MLEPHVIRLRGPWEYEPRVAASAADRPPSPQQSADEKPSPARVHMPADWRAMFGDKFHGRIRFRRHFNRPTGLEPREQVWLVIEGACAAGTVALNDVLLGRIAAVEPLVEFDATERLATGNTLEIDVELPPPSTIHFSRPKNVVDCPIGEVRLEIRQPREV